MWDDWDSKVTAYAVAALRWLSKWCTATATTLFGRRWQRYQRSQWPKQAKLNK